MPENMGSKRHSLLATGGGGLIGRVLATPTVAVGGWMTIYNSSKVLVEQIAIDHSTGDYAFQTPVSTMNGYLLVVDLNVCAIQMGVTVGTVQFQTLQDGTVKGPYKEASYAYDAWGECENDMYTPVRIPILLIVQ